MAVPLAPASSCVSSCRHLADLTVGDQASHGRRLLGKKERAVGGPWGRKKCRYHTQNRAIWSDGPTSPSLEA